MSPDPPGDEHEDLGQFLVAPTPAGPGPIRPGVAPPGATRPGATLATEAALAALVMATEAGRTADDATRAADRVGVEARAGRRRLWRALILLAALALAALALAAASRHPAGLP